MKILLGSDHAGYALKNHLVAMLQEEGHTVTDKGTHTAESADYPDYAEAVARGILAGEGDLGVLVCGTGAGICIAANKFAGIRATACSETVTAALSRSHNDANIVCIGERVVGIAVAEAIVRTFISTPFSQGERHMRRIVKIRNIEQSHS